MLISVLICLTAESSYPLITALGRPAQAWFLQQVMRVDPLLANSLHDESGLKPYTVSTLLDGKGRPLVSGSWIKPGQECWLRITTIDSTLASLLERKILPHLPQRLTLYKMDFRVDGIARTRAEHPWAGRSSFVEIAQDVALANSEHAVRFEFASPTAFRNNGLDVSIPIPGQVFRSLSAKWNAFCPEAMCLQDTWPTFAENCIFVDELTAINTIHWEFAEGTRGNATGFTGTVGFKLPSQKKLHQKWQNTYGGAAAVMQALAQFAFFAGVGHHATIGMGQARVLVANRNLKNLQTSTWEVAI